MGRFIAQCGNFTGVIPGYKVFSDVVGEGDPFREMLVGIRPKEKGLAPPSLT